MTTVRWVTCAMLASTVVVAGAGQSSPSQKPSGSLSGRVVVAGSMTPIEGATVALVNSEQSAVQNRFTTAEGTVVWALPRADRLVQETNARGEFAFENLPPGLYELAATQSPYLPAAYGQTRPGSEGAGVGIRVASGQRAENLLVSMALPNAIAGVIRDEKDEPVPGTAVRVLRYDWVAGQRTLREAGRVATDDRGAYRVAELRPGEYLVAAMPRAEGGVPKPAQVYFPGTPIVASAQSIVLDTGEERAGIDIQARPARIASVSGTLAGADGQALDNVRLAAIDLVTGSAPSPGLAQFDTYALSKDGAFTFANVPPGSYRLMAAARQTVADGVAVDVWAMADISVDDRDVTDVRLDLRRSGTLSGKVVIDPARPRVAGAGTVVLEPLDPGRQGLFMPLGRAEADGQFTISGIVPGRYALSFPRLPDGTFVKSIRAGGRDLLDVAIDIGPSEDVNGVEVTLTDRKSLLTGRLLDGMGRPTSSYLVVVFPADEKYWLAASPRIRTARPASDGQYAFKDLPAGAYQLAALTDAESGEWFAPAFLRKIAGVSVAVTIAEGGSKTFDVRVR